MLAVRGRKLLDQKDVSSRALMIPITDLIIRMASVSSGAYRI